MANEHIGKLHQIGFGKEVTAGTAVDATAWFALETKSFVPKVQSEVFPGSYGTIDAVNEMQVTQRMTEINLSGSPRSTTFGMILHQLLGLAYDCVKFPIPGSITGTFVEGETVTESTSSATGVLRRLDSGGSSKALYLDPVSGTFTGGQTLTGGTSSATATGGTIESPSAVKHHIFRRDNTNNHPAYTITSVDPLETIMSAYCMLDQLEIEFVAGQFVTFTASYMGKMFATTTITPSYGTEYSLVSKHVTFKFASAFTGLDAASGVSVLRGKLTFSKNVEAIQEVNGTDNITFHNGQFDVTGDVTLKWNATTYRDLHTAGTSYASRITIANTAVTLGSAANPTLQFDIPNLFFTEIAKEDTPAEIIKQTLTFRSQRDSTRGFPVEAMLVNSQTASY